jgi:hypothetical protein
VPIQEEGGWAPETAYTFLRRDRSLILAGIRTLNGSGRSLVNVPNTPALLRRYYAVNDNYMRPQLAAVKFIYG